MGGWLSRRDDRSSFKKQLEELDTKLEKMGEKKQTWLRRQRWVVSRFLMFSALLELLFIGYGYLWFYHLRTSSPSLLGVGGGVDPLKQLGMHLGPIFFYPFLVYFFSKALSRYFRRKLEKADDTVKELREDQIKKLNQLMEMTDFTFIQNYHEKIRKQNPHLFRNQPPISTVQPIPQPKATPKSSASKHTNPATTPASAGPAPGTPKALPPASTNNVSTTPQFPPQTQTPVQVQQQVFPQTPTTATPTGNLRQRPVALQRQAQQQAYAQTQNSAARVPPPPRQYTMPVAVVAPPPEPLPQVIPAGERTFFNKMVDWIIGDGPENSVSQICERCKKFNGTIPKEEATFNQFTCYYCKHSNGKGIPQVLTQPILPKQLPAPLQLASPSPSSSSSSSRKRLEEELPNLKTEEEEEKGRPVPVEIKEKEEEQAGTDEVGEVTQADDEKKDTPVQEEEKENEEEVEND